MPIQIVIEVDEFEDIEKAFAGLGYTRSDVVLHQSRDTVPEPETKPEPPVAKAAAADKPAPTEKKPRRKRRTQAEMAAAKAEMEAAKATAEAKLEAAGIPAQVVTVTSVEETPDDEGPTQTLTEEQHKERIRERMRPLIAKAWGPVQEAMLAHGIENVDGLLPDQLDSFEAAIEKIANAT